VAPASVGGTYERRTTAVEPGLHSVDAPTADHLLPQSSVARAAGGWPRDGPAPAGSARGRRTPALAGGRCGCPPDGFGCPDGYSLTRAQVGRRCRPRQHQVGDTLRGGAGGGDAEGRSRGAGGSVCWRQVTPSGGARLGRRYSGTARQPGHLQPNRPPAGPPEAPSPQGELRLAGSDGSPVGSQDRLPDPPSRQPLCASAAGPRPGRGAAGEVTQSRRTDPSARLARELDGTARPAGAPRDDRRTRTCPRCDVLRHGAGEGGIRVRRPRDRGPRTQTATALRRWSRERDRAREGRKTGGGTAGRAARCFGTPQLAGGFAPLPEGIFAEHEFLFCREIEGKVGARQGKSTERLADGRGDTARGFRPTGRGTGRSGTSSAGAVAAPRHPELLRQPGGARRISHRGRETDRRHPRVACPGTLRRPGRRGQRRSSVARGSGRRKARTRFGLRPGRGWVGRRSRSTDRHESGGPSRRRVSARRMRGHRLQASPEGLADPFCWHPDFGQGAGRTQADFGPAATDEGSAKVAPDRQGGGAGGTPHCFGSGKRPHVATILAPPQESGGPTRHGTRASARGSGDEVTETGAIDTAAQIGPEEAFRRIRAAGPKSLRHFWSVRRGTARRTGFGPRARRG
jgi:hypothetical protein